MGNTFRAVCGLRTAVANTESRRLVDDGRDTWGTFTLSEVEHEYFELLKWIRELNVSEKRCSGMSHHVMLLQ